MFAIKQILLVFVTVCVGMDFVRQKISNWWIIFGWIMGMTWQIFNFGVGGIARFTAGAVFPIAGLYLLFYFRMLGAGDIKLLSVLGGVMGVFPVLKCFGYSVFFGGILSIAILCICGNLLQRLRYFGSYLCDFFYTREKKPYYKRGQQLENLHFSVPILMGVLMYVGGFY